MWADASLNRPLAVRVVAGSPFAQVSIVGFDGKIELEALRLFELPKAAPATETETITNEPLKAAVSLMR